MIKQTSRRSVQVRKPLDAASCESPKSKRRQIVKAATKVFLSNGYEGTSVADVASAAGVIKATIYSHFKDKNALFKAIIEDLTLKEGMDRFESKLEAVEPEEFIDILAERLTSRHTDPQFRALLRVVIGESGRFPELARLFYETVSARGIGLVSSYLATRKDLYVPDPTAAAHLLIGSLVYWMLTQEILGGKYVMPIASQRIVTALKLLFTKPARRKQFRQKR